MAPSVLFTDNAITRDIENNNATIETAKNAQDFCLHVAAQFKVRQRDIDDICVSKSTKVSAFWIFMSKIHLLRFSSETYSLQSYIAVFKDSTSIVYLSVVQRTCPGERLQELWLFLFFFVCELRARTGRTAELLF